MFDYHNSQPPTLENRRFGHFDRYVFYTDLPSDISESRLANLFF